MINDHRVGILFKMNSIDYITLVDARSRNRFRKLISEWAPVDGQLITEPEENRTFQYLDVNKVLNEIENTYKELQNTPAIERIAEKVFKIINTIRIQNDIPPDEIEEDEEAYETSRTR